MSSRDYRYFPEAGVTFGLNTEGKTAKIAVSTCSEEDPYSRETGKQIVDLLFDASDNTLRALHLKRNVFSFPYNEEKTRKEILVPLVDAVSEVLDERSLFRYLRMAFDAGVTSTHEAYDFAEATGNVGLKEVFEALDKEEKEILKEVETVEEFNEVFFDWATSANAIVNAVKKHVSELRLTLTKPHPDTVWAEKAVLKGKVE